MTRAEYMAGLNEAIANGTAPAWREANPPTRPAQEATVLELIADEPDEGQEGTE